MAPFHDTHSAKLTTESSINETYLQTQTIMYLLDTNKTDFLATNFSNTTFELSTNGTIYEEISQEIILDFVVLVQFIPDWCNLFNFMVYFVLGGVICVFGFVGNCIVQWMLYAKWNTNSTSFLLLTLAVFDNSVLSLHFIGKSIPALCYYIGSHAWVINYLDPIMQSVGWSVAHIAQMCAAWNIVLVSFCRYIAVCKPLETNKYSSIATIHRCFATIVACIILFYLPRFFRVSIKLDADGSKLRLVPAEYTKSMAYFVYEVPVNYIVMYLVPVTMLMTMTYKQIRVLRDNKAKVADMTRSKRNENDITRTLIVVVIAFMICHIWEPIRRLIAESSAPSKYDCSGMMYQSVSLKVFFTTLNSSINIVIYSLYHKRFRADFRRRVRDTCGFCHNSIRPEMETVSTVGMERKP